MVSGFARKIFRPIFTNCYLARCECIIQICSDLDGVYDSICLRWFFDVKRETPTINVEWRVTMS
ncbi:hypothetical protein TorRG33x02_160430 [Trema orientale]|uniref:Uncharacterized protein n=1 Tax=Trema orientale TaxID=63057 RepID=A0A2P5ERN9_TREOI|nr:hypothetical protein TorRG33x02_160430 [Trema orientale]